MIRTPCCLTVNSRLSVSLGRAPLSQHRLGCSSFRVYEHSNTYLLANDIGYHYEPANPDVSVNAEQTSVIEVWHSSGKIAKEKGSPDPFVARRETFLESRNTYLLGACISVIPTERISKIHLEQDSWMEGMSRCAPNHTLRRGSALECHSLVQKSRVIKPLLTAYLTSSLRLGNPSRVIS